MIEAFGSGRPSRPKAGDAPVGQAFAFSFGGGDLL